MAIHTVAENAPYRLVRDDDGRYAVIEARSGKVYSLHGRDRRHADDSPEGIAAVVGDDGWRDERRARTRFEAMCRGEERYSRIIW